MIKNEIRLVLETFKKCRVNAEILKKSELSEFAHASPAGEIVGKGQIFEILPERLLPRTVYKISTSLDLRYICLEASEEGEILLVGPYLAEAFTTSQMLEIGEKNGVSPKHMRYLEEYYGGLAVLEEHSPLFVMLDGLCESIWASPAFSIVDLTGAREAEIPITPPSTEEDENNSVGMKALEQRYKFENEMIHAVSLGQIHKEKQLLSAFSEEAFEKRLSDRLRNAKNYSIIMNTLLRKAAESGGVHPIYIDRVSSGFASKIESMTYLNENSELMREMFRTYCRLVHKHSIGKYSQIVQKTVIEIDSDLSADLSLTALAKKQSVSAGYLSAVFKKETGKTLSEYITEKRMEYAKYLLETTQLQIQTVAQHTGIMDMQYFSKVFKRYTCMTPREYRLNNEKLLKSP